MAKRTIHLLVDDIDGSEARHTITFEIEGKRYEIDLSDANAEEFRRTFARYTEAGYRVRNGLRSTYGKAAKEAAVTEAASFGGKVDKEQKASAQAPTDEAAPAQVKKSVPPAVARKPVTPAKRVPPADKDTSTYTRTAVTARPPTKIVRQWAKDNGIPVPDKGAMLKPEVYEAYERSLNERTNGASAKIAEPPAAANGKEAAIEAAPAKKARKPVTAARRTRAGAVTKKIPPASFSAGI